MGPATKAVFFLCGILALLVADNAAADQIVLKDGNIVESDKIWQSEKYVHFILKGTSNVEIRYSRDIVDRIIESNYSQKQIKPSPSKQQIQLPSIASPVDKSEDSTDRSAQDHLPELNSTRGAERMEKLNVPGGISFFDPRRPQRYWAAPNSKHTTLDAALEALARQYGRTSQWVTEHMGEENDLKVIHDELYQKLKSEENGNQSTFPEIFKEKQSLPEVEIKKLNGERKIQEDREKYLSDMAGKGILFYNPRRPDKYWVSRTAHYNTMGAAIDALAAHYGVKASWIEDQMGSTNDLAEIHRNIQQSLHKQPNPSK